MTLNPRLEKIKTILVRPECENNLDFSREAATCPVCARHYPVREGKIYFLTEIPEIPDKLDKIKLALKKNLGFLYYRVGVDVLAPTYPFNFLKRILQRLDPSQKIVVDVG